MSDFVNPVIAAGVTSDYQSGSTLSNATVLGTVRLNGATTVSSVISSGGKEYAGRAQRPFSSGVSIDTQVHEGGTLLIENKGKGSGATIFSGGSASVSNDGWLYDAVVSSGGIVSSYYQYYRGGKTSGTKVLSGGTLQVGGTGFNDMVEAGGTLEVISGGTEIASAVSIDSAHIRNGLLSAGTDTVIANCVIDGGGRIDAVSGAIISNALIHRDGVVNIDHEAIVSSAVIEGGGQLNATNGATLHNGRIEKFGSATFNFGGSLRNVVNSGVIDVRSGTALNVTVGTSGLMETTSVANGSSWLQNTVISGGTVILGENAKSVSSYIVSGGQEFVGRAQRPFAKAASEKAQVHEGGTLLIENEGKGSGATIFSGGSASVSNDGWLYDAVVSSGGIVSSYYQYYRGGKTSGTKVLSGGTLQVGGTGFNDMVEAGGTLEVISGGTEIASAVSIDSAHIRNGVLSAGTDTVIANSVIDGGGRIDAVSGAIISSALIRRDGVVNIDHEVIVSSAVIEGGGQLNAANGATLCNGRIEKFGSATFNFGGSLRNVVNSGVIDVRSGTALNVTVGTSGLMETTSVANGSSLLQNTVISGGTVILGENAKSVSSYIVSGGQEFVGRAQRPFAKAISENAQVHEGGTLLIENEGKGSGATIFSGGSASVSNDGWLYDAVVSAGGVVSSYYQYYRGGKTSGTKVLSGGTLLARGTSLNDRVEAGGTLEVISGGAASGTVIQGGGTVVHNADDAMSGAYLREQGSIDFNYLGSTITSAFLEPTGKLTVWAANGKTTSIQLAGSYSVNEFRFTGDTLTLLCFLAGTAIRTPWGESAVEDLRIGDEVLTWDPQAQKEVTRKLRWVGSKKNVYRPDLPDDEAGYPVRICAHAFADNVPSRDLLLTAEHCLFIDGNFIPARMLVNGHSIHYDKTMADFTVYHIETDHHAIIWAENTLSESYLDTGNRRGFNQHGALVSFGGQVGDWATTAAAPLNTSREVVEPIYQRITARLPEFEVDRPLVHGLDLHLITDKGVRLDPVRTRDTKYVFKIPGATRFVTLVSRKVRPCDNVGPFVDDRRFLGVLVGEVTLFDEQHVEAVSAHLADETLSGWHGLEAAPCRWTDGRATLPLPESNGTSRVLAINILAGGPYLEEPLKQEVLAG